MGTTLTGQTKASTYDSLLKITDNGPVGATEKVVTDGLGNDSALKIGTAGVSSTGTLSAAGLLTASAGANVTGDVAINGTTSRQVAAAMTGGSSNFDIDITDSGGGTPTVRILRSSTVGTKLQVMSAGTGTVVSEFSSTGLSVTGGISATGGINSTAIGATTPDTGAFTTLSASSGINSTAIGASTPSTGAFTTLSSTGAITGGSTIAATTNITAGGTIAATGNITSGGTVAGLVGTLGSMGCRAVTVSASSPSLGADGDVWLQYV